jgi:hypothetical protein
MDSLPSPPADLFLQEPLWLQELQESPFQVRQCSVDVQNLFLLNIKESIFWFCIKITCVHHFICLWSTVPVPVPTKSCLYYLYVFWPIVQLCTFIWPHLRLVLFISYITVTTQWILIFVPLSVSAYRIAFSSLKDIGNPKFTGNEWDLVYKITIHINLYRYGFTSQDSSLPFPSWTVYRLSFRSL